MTVGGSVAHRERSLTTDLALGHLTIAEASPEELVETASQAGYRGVGMRVCGFEPADDPVGLIGDAGRVKALRSRLADTGLALVNVCSYRLTAEREARDYRPVFDLCAELGADTLLITCFLADEGRRADLVASLAAQAEPLGLRIGLEFFRSSALRSLAAAEALKRASGARSVGHIIDALHAFRADVSAAELASLSPDVIYGFQLCDALARPLSDEALRAEVRRRLLPGEGDIPLGALLDALPETARIEVEAPVADAAGRSLLDRARAARRAAESILSSRRPARDTGRRP